MSLVTCPEKKCPLRATCPHRDVHSSSSYLSCEGGLGCPPCEPVPTKLIELIPINGHLGIWNANIEVAA